jgi:esterase/lipase superfamily enzyme
MHREHRVWDSPSLGRPMELIWYGHWGRPVLAFPTSLGRAMTSTTATSPARWSPS